MRYELSNLNKYPWSYGYKIYLCSPFYCFDDRLEWHRYFKCKVIRKAASELHLKFYPGGLLGDLTDSIKFCQGWLQANNFFIRVHLTCLNDGTAFSRPLPSNKWVEIWGVGTFYITSDTSGKNRRGKWNSDWKENGNYFFYVLLTVHRSIILVINQLDAQNLAL